MKRLVIALLIALGPSDALADEMAEMYDAVRYQLKDPDSAKFRNVRKGAIAYCGEVNAKNSFGGYVGFERFSAFKNDKGEWVVNLETEFADIVNIACKY